MAEAEDVVARVMLSGLDLRVGKCEENCLRLASGMNECKEHEESLRGKIWDKLNRLEVELAKTSVKIALIVGVVSAIGSSVVSALLSWAIK